MLNINSTGSKLTLSLQDSTMVNQMKQGLEVTLGCLQENFQGILNLMNRHFKQLFTNPYAIAKKYLNPQCLDKSKIAVTVAFTTLLAFTIWLKNQEMRTNKTLLIDPSIGTSSSRNSVAATTVNSIATTTIQTAPEQALPIVTTTTKNRNEEIKEKALKSTHLKKLYDLAVNTGIQMYDSKTKTYNYSSKGEWTVEFVSTTYSGFPAECDYHNRKVKLQSNLSDEMAISYFAFELTK